MICPNCNGSEFVKHGFVLGVQRFKCTSCGRNVTEKTFSPTYRHRHTIHQIRAAVALMLLTNASSRTAKTIFSLFMGSSPSNVTLWEWMYKFKDRLDIASRSFRKVQAGRIWHIDEVFIRVRGSTSKKDCSYLVIVRDQHGAVLAVEVGHRRDARLIGKALNRAKKNAKQTPAIVVSDEFRAYPKALNKAFPKDHKRDNPKHAYAHFGFRRVQHRKRRYKLSNNCIERTNSFVREWTHGKRGFKSLSSAQSSFEAWAAAHNARHAGVGFWYRAFP